MLGIRLQSVGLLQLDTQRHHRVPFSMPAVGAKRSSQTDHTDRTTWAHHACLTTTSLAACSTPYGIQAGRSRVQGSTQSRAAVPLRQLSCWWQKSVDVCDRLMHGLVVYRGPGPCSLVTGVLLWLVRGSGTVYQLHCVTLTVFTASESSLRCFCFFKDVFV